MARYFVPSVPWQWGVSESGQKCCAKCAVAVVYEEKWAVISCQVCRGSGVGRRVEKIFCFGLINFAIWKKARIHTRDWALLTAKDLLLKEAGEGAVKVEARTVTVNGAVAFKQEKEDSRGSFVGERSHLKLPS